MALYAPVGKSDFTPCPEGVFQAVCVDVIDLGVIETTWQGQMKRQHKINIRFYVEETMEDGRPFQVQRRFTLSMHKKGNLRPFLETWRGKSFASDEEAAAFDIEQVIGANAVLQVMHHKTEKGTFARIATIMPIRKGTPKLGIPHDYVRVQDRKESAFDEALKSDQPAPGDLIDDEDPIPF